MSQKHLIESQKHFVLDVSVLHLMEKLRHHCSSCFISFNHKVVLTPHH